MEILSYFKFLLKAQRCGISVRQNRVCLSPICTFKFPACRHLVLHDVII